MGKFGRVWFLAFCACSSCLFGEEVVENEDDLVALPTPRDAILARKDAHVTFGEGEDSYLEGYIQALVDVHYYELNVIVVVEDGVVMLYNLPKNDLISNSIITFICHLPEVKEVKCADGVPEKNQEAMDQYEVRKQIDGIWFPQSTVLFQPLIANLREPIYSAGYRWGDNVFGNHVIAVSFGDTFPIFRWRNVFTWYGDMQIDIQAGVWASFKMAHMENPDDEFAELINTDYLVGIPLTYAINAWSFRLRVYHISSHVGDEFMDNNPGFKRVNPSMEALEFMSSCQVLEGLRVYFGPGWVFNSDPTFPLDPFYVEYGFEFRGLGSRNYYHRIYGTPFIAMDFQNWQQNGWRFRSTYQLGYEWSKLQGVGRKVRLFAQYYDGFSEGQFFNDKTSYFSIRFSYGF